MMEFFKANEKVIWVVLLVILAPSFAATGLMLPAFQQSRANYDAYEVSGKTLKSGDLMTLRDHYARVQQVTYFLGTGTVTSLRSVMPATPRVLEIYIQLNEARARGLAVSPEELEKVARQAAKNLIALRDVLPAPGTSMDNNTFISALRERQKVVRFTESEYRAALRDERLGLRMSVREFEDLIAEALLLEQFAGLAGNSVVVSDKEVYDEFEEDWHRRKFKFVRISPSEYLDEARASVTDADLEARWNESQGEEFRLPSRLALEIAQLPKNVVMPTEDELLAEYEATKNELFLNPDGTFRPFDQARGLVMSRLQAKREEEIVTQALAEGQRLYAEGRRDLELLDLFGEHAPLVEVSTTKAFSSSEIKDLPGSFLNGAVLAPLFYVANFNNLKVGEFGKNTVVPQSGGRYLYRIAEKIEEKTPTTREEVGDRLRDAVARSKALELATKYLETWKDRLGGTDVTFESLAAEKNLKVHTTEPLSAAEAAKFMVDGRAVPSAFIMVQAGFDIAALGGLSQPVPYTNPVDEDDSQVYLLQLAELSPADPAGFERREPQLRGQVERRKREAANSEFRLMVYDQAQVKRLFEVTEETPGDEAP
ncbi:MAG: hypothetical protein AB7O52_07400 [Planctomycetota bacterium]